MKEKKPNKNSKSVSCIAKFKKLGSLKFCNENSTKVSNETSNSNVLDQIGMC